MEQGRGRPSAGASSLVDATRCDRSRRSEISTTYKLRNGYPWR